MATPVELTLGDYLGMFRRHVLLMVAIFLAGSLVSVLVASLVPSVFESSSVIQVVPQDISPNLIPAAFNDYADQKIERIRQRVMTRDNILDIARRYHLYGADKDATASEVVDAFDRDVAVDLINTKDPVQSRQVNPTIAFSVSFRGHNPWIVNKVDNDLATLFLSENARAGITRANEATRFLNQAMSDLQSQLDDASRKLFDFKSKNAGALPENRDVELAAYQATDATLRDINQEYQQTQDSINNLELQMQAVQLVPGASADATSAESTDPAVELARLKAQYAKLQAVYSDQHPTMISLRDRIRALQQQVQSAAPASGEADKTTGAAAGGVTGSLAQRVVREKAYLVELDRRRVQAQARLSAIQNQLIAEPQVGQQLAVLQGNYDDLKKKYDDLSQKQSSAQMDASLQEENKAEHFDLVEPSMLAEKPIKPNRIKLLLAGIAGSLVASVAAVVLLESMGGKVRGVSGLAAISGMSPLVVIPQIQTREELHHQRRMVQLGVVGLVAGLLVSLLAIQLFVMPLPKLVAKIQNYSTVKARGDYDKTS